MQVALVVRNLSEEENRSKTIKGKEQYKVQSADQRYKHERTPDVKQKHAISILLFDYNAKQRPNGTCFGVLDVRWESGKVVRKIKGV